MRLARMRTVENTTEKSLDIKVGMLTGIYTTATHTESPRRTTNSSNSIFTEKANKTAKQIERSR